jgi:hypothetical protein
MPKVNLIAAVRRACVAAALALSIISVPAHAASVTVDGDLTDLIGKVGIYELNTASGTDPMGSADSPMTESNNGFDIQNVYAYYDWSVDVLYLGMSVYGTVGDSLPITDITNTNENADPFYDFICGSTWCNRNVFDSTETYGIQLYLGTSTADPQLLLYSVLGADDGSDSALGNNPHGFIVTHAVSETYNGVEFSVAGLYASGQLIDFPGQDLLVRFDAGSGDLNATSSMAEDAYLLQMQLVPVPAAVWLFGSGLLGLVAVARKRRKMAS